MKYVFTKNIKFAALIIVAILAAIMVWGVFVPYSLNNKPETVFVVQKGMGYKQIGIALEKQGIIANHGFFSAYALVSLNYNKLQAGRYNLSPSMSVADIVKKFAEGDIIKNTITIIEGWKLQDIGNYLEAKKIMSSAEFSAAAKNSATDFDFLKDKPKKLNLEGYIFPDTYQLAPGAPAKVLVNLSLANFDKKLTPELRKEIASQKKSIFEIITMASLIEKEVQTPQDKKIVSGILWKRIQGGMPLQVDATINYITGKTDGGVTLLDTKIDSPYNTYKYYGLPLGPICNPGMDSILAAIYPTKSDYWYYLSADGTGKTIFSKTLEEHNAAVAKYLKK